MLSTTLPFWLSSGRNIRRLVFIHCEHRFAGKIRQAAGPLYTILDRKYYIDELYSWFFVGGARTLGSALWKVGDVTVIDGFFVNGTARVVAGAAILMQRFQSGYIYHYAFTMIVGIFILMSLWLFP